MFANTIFDILKELDMAAATKAFLEEAYLAYFGRPADPNGALFWLQPGTTEADVVNGFSNSAESVALSSIRESRRRLLTRTWVAAPPALPA